MICGTDSRNACANNQYVEMGLLCACALCGQSAGLRHGQFLLQIAAFMCSSASDTNTLIQVNHPHHRVGPQSLIRTVFLAKQTGLGKSSMTGFLSRRGLERGAAHLPQRQGALNNSDNRRT
jgi:hypothetical protein